MNKEEFKHEDDVNQRSDEPADTSSHLINGERVEDIEQIDTEDKHEPAKSLIASHLRENQAEASAKAEPANTSGQIILQWLTYAFWGWTLLAVVWLLYIILGNMIANLDVSGMIPYAIAASLVLLPVSFLCDWFYGKNEPANKTGAAMVVMVIHAVIFALFAIGTLISAVLIMVQLAIATPSSSSGQTVWLATFFISALLYLLTFLRTLNPWPKLKVHRKYPLFMGGLMGVLIVVGFVGPVTQASLTKDDRDIVKYLPNVSDSINSYVKETENLPTNLNEVTLDPDGKKLVERGLVTYKKEDVSDESKADAESFYGDMKRTYYRYQLCVKYKQATPQHSTINKDGEEYNDSLFVYEHPAGEVCYKIETSLKNISSESDLESDYEVYEYSYDSNGNLIDKSRRVE